MTRSRRGKRDSTESERAKICSPQTRQGSKFSNLAGMEMTQTKRTPLGQLYKAAEDLGLSIHQLGYSRRSWLEEQVEEAQQA
jgi:hypothetical protein